MSDELARALNSMALPSCANCGMTIGRLDTPHTWGDHIVCGQCLAVLVRSANPSAALPSPPYQTHQPHQTTHVFVNHAPSPRRISGVVTIQKTGKAWKLMTLIGVLSILAGAVIVTIGVVQPAAAMLLPGAMLLAAGVPIWIFARMGAWWFHG